jgi:metal-dependent HD superfamily phosphatase/phosphodiesterase
MEIKLRPTKWPEWKRLLDAVPPLLDKGVKDFTHEELSVLAGVDITSNRGRAQFYKFRKELLKLRSVWLENVLKLGYGVIEAKEHPAVAFRRVKHARRKFNQAVAINTFVKHEELTHEQRAMQAATAAMLHDLGHAFHDVGRKFHLASRAVAAAPPIDVQKLLNSIASTPTTPRRRVEKMEGPESNQK